MSSSLDHDLWLKLVSRPAEILVVEDDPLFAEVMLGIMQGYNCTPRHALNGKDAVRLLDAVNFDLIILDIIMPEMNGIEVLRHVHKHHPDVPVLVLSGHITERLIQEVSELGLVAFVAKPSRGTMEALVKLLRMLGIKKKGL